MAEAVRLFKLAAAQGLVHAQFNLARVLIGKGEYGAARSELGRAARLRPSEQAVQQLLKQIDGK